HARRRESPVNSALRSTFPTMGMLTPGGWIVTSSEGAYVPSGGQGTGGEGAGVVKRWCQDCIYPVGDPEVLQCSTPSSLKRSRSASGITRTSGRASSCL